MQAVSLGRDTTRELAPETGPAAMTSSPIHRLSSGNSKSAGYLPTGRSHAQDNLDLLPWPLWDLRQQKGWPFFGRRLLSNQIIFLASDIRHIAHDMQGEAEVQEAHHRGSQEVRRMDRHGLRRGWVTKSHHQGSIGRLACQLACGTISRRTLADVQSVEGLEVAWRWHGPKGVCAHTRTNCTPQNIQKRTVCSEVNKVMSKFWEGHLTDIHKVGSSSTFWKGPNTDGEGQMTFWGGQNCPKKSILSMQCSNAKVGRVAHDMMGGVHIQTHILVSPCAIHQAICQTLHYGQCHRHYVKIVLTPGRINAKS